MRNQALTAAPPRPAPGLSGSRAGLPLLLALLLLLLVVPPAGAAEVLQVRQGGLLQVGDRNRSYTIRLACLEIAAGREAAATAWLRQELPRRTRVNLHPLGESDGQLLAKVSRLDQSTDLSSGLIAAGLAEPIPCPGETGTDPEAGRA